MITYDLNNSLEAVDSATDDAHVVNIVIEVESRNRRALHKFSVGEQPVIIGRGWESDLIVQDEHVDAEHLIVSLTVDGRLLLTDNKSLNGSLLNGRDLREAVVYRSGDELRLGETQLRIHYSDDSVPAPTLVSLWQNVKATLSTRKAVLCLTLLSVLIVALNESLSATSPYYASSFLKSALRTVGVLLTWGLGMGLISKLLRHQMNAFAHWSLAALFLIVAVVVDFITDIYRFNIQDSGFSDKVDVVTVAILLGVFAYGSLTFATFLQHRVKQVLAILVALIPLATLLITPMLKQDHELWTSSTRSESLSMPPALLFKSQLPLTELLAKTDSVFDRLDEEVRSTKKMAE